MPRRSFFASTGQGEISDEGEGEEKSAGNVFRAGAVSGQEETVLFEEVAVGREASGVGCS